jgi:hypothetical protein
MTVHEAVALLAFSYSTCHMILTQGVGMNLDKIHDVNFSVYEGNYFESNKLYQLF